MDLEVGDFVSGTSYAGLYREGFVKEIKWEDGVEKAYLEITSKDYTLPDRWICWKVGGVWKFDMEKGSEVKILKKSGEKEKTWTFSFEKDKKNNQKNTMSSFKSVIKDILRKEPEKSFVKAGFMDDCEELTQDGREALIHIILQDKKEALLDLAKQVIEANDKESKKE